MSKPDNISWFLSSLQDSLITHLKLVSMYKSITTVFLPEIWYEHYLLLPWFFFQVGRLTVASSIFIRSGPSSCLLLEDIWIVNSIICLLQYFQCNFVCLAVAISKLWQIVTVFCLFPIILLWSTCSVIPKYFCLPVCGRVSFPSFLFLISPWL